MNPRLTIYTGHSDTTELIASDQAQVTTRKAAQPSGVMVAGGGGSCLLAETATGRSSTRLMRKAPTRKARPANANVVANPYRSAIVPPLAVAR